MTDASGDSAEREGPYLGCPKCKTPVELLSISCGADPHRKYYCPACSWTGRTGNRQGPKYVMPDTNRSSTVHDDA